jgi:hypothetical protein
MASQSKSNVHLLRQNLRAVKLLYPGTKGSPLAVLRELTKIFQLSVPRGEILSLDGKWYITHSGLLRLAHRRRCGGIRVQ